MNVASHEVQARNSSLCNAFASKLDSTLYTWNPNYPGLDWSERVFFWRVVSPQII